MKKLFYLITLLLVSNSSSAQVHLDSLLTIWNDENRVDTIRMEALYKYIWGPKLYISNTDSALTLSNRMYAMAIKSKSKK